MRVSRLLTAAIAAGSLLLAGCGSPVASLSGTARVAGSAQARQVVKTVKPKPTLEQAFEVAVGVARQLGGEAPLITASGYGVGRDGRLLTPEEQRRLQPDADVADLGGEWMFSFRNERRTRGTRGELFMIDVQVTSTGQVTSQESSMIAGMQAWTFRPSESIPLARAMQLALRDGLAGDVFRVHISPADGHFMGALPAYTAPPSYLIGTGASYAESRQISARSGLLHQEPTAADLELVRRLMVPIVGRWHASLTGGEDRPVTGADLVRAGFDPDGTDQYIGMFDRDGDRRIARNEFLATFSTPQWLMAWREMAIKTEYYRADRNQDERLTPDEASRVAFTYTGLKGEKASYPLPFSATEFADADLDRNGTLDLNEFMPLGTLKTLRLIELEPKAGNSFFFIQTKPWSH